MSQDHATSSPSSNVINDKYINHSNVESNDNEHVSLKECCFDAYEFEMDQNSGNVKGRLHNHLSFWKDIQANGFLLDVIENGYSIPFIETPPKMFRRNNKSALHNADFVSVAVSDLLSKGCVVKVKVHPYVVSPLSVATNKSGKKRLILDLHELNRYVWKAKVNFEDYKVALTYFQDQHFMFKFDFKSGYHHLDIADWCQTYLGFSWEGHFYVFTVLPFGLSSSPFIVTKCLRPLVRFWREHGLNIVLYLDDGWCINQTYRSALTDAEFVFELLRDAGFLGNIEKSVFTTIQSIVWLGLCWNTSTFAISIPDTRISEIAASIGCLLNNKAYVTARRLAKIGGRIISLIPVIGNVARIKTRSLFRCIGSAAFLGQSVLFM